MSKKILFAGAVALVAGLLVFGGGDDDETKTEHSTTWNNQVWIDQIPVRETDKINVFAAINDPQFGVFQSASQWEGDYTIFTWTDKGDGKVELEMMQTGKKHKIKVSVSTKDCGRFDVCMTVKGAPRGPKKYYSMHDWVIEGQNLTGSELAARAWSLIQESLIQER